MPLEQGHGTCIHDGCWIFSTALHVLKSDQIPEHMLDPVMMTLSVVWAPGELDNTPIKSSFARRQEYEVEILAIPDFVWATYQAPANSRA